MRCTAAAHLANLLAFQAGWLACVLGAGYGHPAAGPLAVTVVLGMHVWLLPCRRTFGLFLIVVGLLGTGIDTGLGLLGLLSFPGSVLPVWLCPPWLTFLWMLFASTLPMSLNWLTARPWLAAVFGAVGGPASYYAGAAFGALRLADNPLIGLATLAVVWSMLVPMLLRLKQRMGLPARPV
jgi:hypothetical protein